MAASASQDGTVRLWRQLSRGFPGRPPASLQGHVSGIQNIVLSRNDLLVAGGSYDGTVKLWDVASGRLLVTLRGHIGAVSGVELSADGRSSGKRPALTGTKRLWEAAPGGLAVTTLEGHTGGVLSVAPSAAGILVVSGGDDGTIRLWSPASRAIRRVDS